MSVADELMKLADDYRAATRKNDIVGVARERLESRLRELLEGDAAAYLVHARSGMVRACWTTPPTDDQKAAAEFDGDTITPLYAAPRPLDVDAISDERIEAAIATWFASDREEQDFRRAMRAAIKAALGAKA